MASLCMTGNAILMPLFYCFFFTTENGHCLRLVSKNRCANDFRAQLMPTDPDSPAARTLRRYVQDRCQVTSLPRAYIRSQASGLGSGLGSGNNLLSCIDSSHQHMLSGKISDHIFHHIISLITHSNHIDTQSSHSRRESDLNPYLSS